MAVPVTKLVEMYGTPLTIVWDEERKQWVDLKEAETGKFAYDPALQIENARLKREITQLKKQLDTTIPTEEHFRIIKEKDQTIQSLKKRLRFRDELDSVPSEVMSQTQKAAFNRAVKELQLKEPDEDGWIPLEKTDDLAKESGMATKTFQKCLTYCHDIGTLEKKTKKVRDEDTGQVLYIETYVKRTELTLHPRLYEVEKERNHGGERIYCKCGSCRINRKAIYTCMDCGTVYDKKPDFLPPLPPNSPEDQVGLLDKEPKNEIEEAGIVDSYLVPDDQIGLLDKNPETLLGPIIFPPLYDQLGPLDKKEVVSDEDDSNNPPLASSLSSSAEHIATITSWLERRRGTPRIIQATGSLKSEDKYISKAASYEPDIEAYILGRVGHIYGSWLRDTDGLTSVLCFDLDYHDKSKPNPNWLEQAQNWLVDFARVGACAIYWQRGEGGHFEICTDQRIDPEAARPWALSVCPDLEGVLECYPCDDKANNPLSWPLWQRIGSEVIPCKAWTILPEPHGGSLLEVDPTDLEALARLVSLAITPAALIPDRDPEPDPGKDKQTRAGGVIGSKPSPISYGGSDRDLIKQVTADFNRTHRIEDMVELNKKGKFCATWRGERTPSVALNRDGVTATDYGRTNESSRFIDAYELYCLLNNIDKKADLAARCAELRRQQSEVVAPEPPAPEPTTTLFSERKPLPMFGTCMVCGSPKTVKRADGAMVCENDCRG
jgi:hypothetical protein